MDTLATLLGAAAALAAVITALFALGRWLKDRKKRRMAEVQQELREHDDERNAFTLGWLVFLLPTFEAKLDSNRFHERLQVILGYFKAIAGPEETRQFARGTTAREFTDVVVNWLHTNRWGRVENGFRIGFLLTLFDAMSVSDDAAPMLKHLAQQRFEIWTEDDAFLPKDKGVRWAARILYDAATAGTNPSGSELEKAKAELYRWYGRPVQ